MLATVKTFSCRILPSVLCEALSLVNYFGESDLGTLLRRLSVDRRPDHYVSNIREQYILISIDILRRLSYRKLPH
jgi:hypothetical protein